MTMDIVNAATIEQSETVEIESKRDTVLSATENSDNDEDPNPKVIRDADESDEEKNLIGRVKKKYNILDSDSEDEPISTSKADESSDIEKNEQDGNPRRRFRTIINSDDETRHSSSPVLKKSLPSGLIDSDSDYEGQTAPPVADEFAPRNKVSLEKKNKKLTKPPRAAKAEAMLQIHSETQRLMRDAPVSLPYHRPRQRTLQDFLNRKKLIPLPNGLTTAAKVKMSSEIVGKVLAEKEREAVIFYKSSESSDDDATPDGPEVQSASCGRIDPIEETQRIARNDVQNAHSKKDIIQQGGVDLGLPRKLFTHARDDKRAISREIKRGMRETSAPRKLFGGDYEEIVDSPSEASNSLAENVAEPKNYPDEGVYSGDKSDEPDESARRVNGDNGEAVEDIEESDISETPLMRARDHRVKCDSVPEVEGPGCARSKPKERLLSGLPCTSPRLQGAPGMTIDLSDDAPSMSGVRDLVDRFMRHSATSLKTSSPRAPVTALHPETTHEGVRLVEEILPYKIPPVDPGGGLDKPGAKYKRLRMDLIQRMAAKRDEEWRLREQRDKENEEDEEDEEEMDSEAKVADDMTGSESEDDIPETERRDNRTDDEEDEEETLQEEEDDISLRVEETEETETPGRVSKAFEDDSQPRVLERSRTDIDMFEPTGDWSDDTEAEFPPSQIPRDSADTRSQSCKTPLATSNALRFVSPITQLTALNNATPDREVAATPVTTTERERDEEVSPYVRDTPCYQKKLFQEATSVVNDEELMGLCSGKFTCAEDDDDHQGERSRNNVADPVNHEAPKSFRVVSEDELDPETPEKHPKKRVQRLVSSDEEDEDDESDDEVPEVQDEAYVDYDSEENEVVLIPGKDIANVAAKFLENEAELSESEWGSEDEDEMDLDRLEFEAADDEDIDEKLVHDQLGEIHARRVQDQDRREVRMLQELLFEDGDLHSEGGGRERKFKWKNIDQLGDEKENPQGIAADADEEADSQDETDLEWRKQRMEREKFIEERTSQSKDETGDELALGTQIFQLGVKALKRKPEESCPTTLEAETSKTSCPRTVLDLVDPDTISRKRPALRKAMTRSSFLARGDACLARIAEFIRDEAETGTLHRPNPKNFVFAQVDPSRDNGAEITRTKEVSSDEESREGKGIKRKPMESTTPRAPKRTKLGPKSLA